MHIPNEDQSEQGGDGVGDACDACRGVFDPDQVDGDLDRAGDLCDKGRSVRNESQHGYGGDSTGDECEIGDGVIPFRKLEHPVVRWQAEAACTSFNLFRGSLAVSPYLGHFCGLTLAFQEDALVPFAGGAYYWLVAGKGLSGEEPLGDGAGVDRPNAAPCP